MTDAGPLTIAVLIKQVPDMNALRVDRASGSIVASGQRVISSYDGYAIEAALRLKEAHGGEVIAVTVGPAAARDAAARALAMGADRGMHLEVADPNATDSLGMAQLLADALMPLRCDIILAGQTSDDVETGQVGAQVAEILGLPVISNVVEVRVDAQGVQARRDMEDGYQTVRSPLPAVILSSTGLDEPRTPSVKGIMAAKKKPLEMVPAALPPEDRLAWEPPFAPARSASGVIVQDVPAAEAASQLVAWLREQKLI